MNEQLAGSCGPSGAGYGSFSGAKGGNLPLSACGLFPLPRPPRLHVPGGLSRRASQRLSKKARIREELIETISALNWMHVGDFDAAPLDSSPLQRDVCRYLESRVSAVGDLDGHGCLPSQEAALLELLRGQDGYAEPATPASLAPFNLELVSLPEDLTGAPCAEDLLNEDDRRYLEVQERMLRDSPKEDEVVCCPYWDPALKHNAKNYRRFIQKLNSIQYLEFTLNPCQHAGVFFVWKSDKKRIRMIIDARPANASFYDPPGISLPTAETFAKVEVIGKEAGGVDGFGIYAGLSDVKDCFHRIKQPRWLAKHFCLLPIEARHVGLTGQTLEGRTLSSSDLVYPMPGSLCMGFSWSLFFAQRISEALMDQVPGLSHSTRIHDRGGPAVFDALQSHEIKHFVYVDNLGVMSSDRQAVSQELGELTDKFTDKKLLLHPGEIQHEHIKALGVQMDGKLLKSTLTPDRFHRVRQGVRGLLRRGRCTGKVLEIVIGHCTYCGLMNRCLLSTFHASYKFIRNSYYEAAPLWNSVKAELRAFSGLMALLVADWSRPWNSVVTVSDASEEGFGVCAAAWEPQVAAEVGRVSERDRFRRAGGHSARESALTSAGFVKDEASGKWADGLLEDEEYLRLSGWDLKQDFPEVPVHQLKSQEWATVRQGAWRRSEHIVHLEARALVKSFEFLVHDTEISHCRQLFLVDSMSASLSFDRCRSKNFRMLRQIRKFCSLALARNVAFSVRWVPSELNPADGPSRDQSQVISVSKVFGVHHGTEEVGCVGTRGCDQKPEEAMSCARAGLRTRGHEEEEAEDFADSKLEGSAVDLPELCAAYVGKPEQARNSVGPPSPVRARRERLLEQLQHGKEGYSCQGSSKEESSSVEKVRGRSHAGPILGTEPVGKKSNWREDSPLLCAGISAIPRFFQKAEAADGCSNRDGCCPHRVLQCAFPPRASSPPRKQGDRLSNAPSSRVQPARHLQIASCLESTKGLAQVGARQFKTGHAPECVGSFCLRDETPWFFADGGLHHALPVVLQPPRRAVEMPREKPCEANAHHLGVLVPPSQPGRETDSFESGRVRRQRGIGLSFPEAMDSHTAKAVDRSEPRPASVELRLWPLLKDFLPDQRHLWFRHDALPDEAQWTKHRSEPQPPFVARSAKERPMEQLQECGTVREKCQVRGELPAVASAASVPLPRLRKTARGGAARPGPSAPSTCKAKGLKGQYFADFFSGEGGVAKAARRLGYAAREWELSNGPSYDLTLPQVQRRIRQDIQQGLILAAMLAPPCSSFSIARDRTSVIRTKLFPWGLPREQLSEADWVRVQTGNRCFKAALKIISWLDQHGIPWIFENPFTSKCWYLPPLQKLATAAHVQTVVVDFCFYQTLWRKRTQLLRGNLDSQDVARLRHLCTGRGLCSFSCKPHFQLTGSNHQGTPWTRIAQPYPRGLCRDLAFSLTSPTHY